MTMASEAIEALHALGEPMDATVTEKKSCELHSTQDSEWKYSHKAKGVNVWFKRHHTKDESGIEGDSMPHSNINDIRMHAVYNCNILQVQIFFPYHLYRMYRLLFLFLLTFPSDLEAILNTLGAQ